MFWILPVSADTPFSKFITGHPLLGENPKQSSAATPPDPANLSSDWWHYFEVQPSDLKKRIDTVSRQLNGILQALPEDEKPSAKVNIDRFNENLLTMLELRKNAGPREPATHSIQKTYTLKQWLDLVHKRRTVQAELQSENEDLLLDEKRVSPMRQHFYSLTAAYLALPDQAPDKPGQGLALMAAWSELAVNSERMRLQKAALTVQNAQLEQLVEESAAAQDRLFVGASELKQLNQEMQAAKSELTAAHQYASELVTSPLTGNLETDDGKARSLLFEQRVIHSAVKEAIADAVVTRIKIELELTRMLTSSDDNEINRLRQQLQNNLDHIDELNIKLNLWRKEAERDQGRAGKSLVALFGTTARQSSGLITLTQQRLSEAQNTLLSLQLLDSEIHDARLVAHRLQALISAKEGALRSGLETVKTSSVKVWELVWDGLAASLFKIGETPVTTLGILRILLIITLAWALSHSVRKGLTHLSQNQSGSSAFLYTLGRLAHYLILIIGISIGLSSIGVDLSNFALIAGALSLGIGFGMQAIVSNFVSGLIVLFERSLRIGDFVELSSGLAGEVRAINVRSTLVTTPDMVEILVPNSEFVNGKVINWTLTDASRRIHIPFGVAYGSDKELVRKAALEAAYQTPHTLKNRSGREPEVWLTNFGDSSLDFELVVWVEPRAVKKPPMVRAAYYWELETALRKYGIEIPFPQRDVHLRSGLKESPILIKNANHLSETNRD